MKILQLILAGGVLISGPALRAQAESRHVEGALVAAINLRVEVTGAIIQNGDNIELALGRLRDHESPTGLGLDRETEFALAAVDVGQRLLAAGHAEEAEQVFAEAENSLGTALEQRAKDASPAERANLLRKRAFIRTQFLGKGELASADFDEAIRLVPDDPSIVRQRNQLLNTDGSVNRPQPRN